MSTNYEHDGEDELQAARRTAHALGKPQGQKRPRRRPSWPHRRRRGGNSRRCRHGRQAEGNG